MNTQEEARRAPAATAGRVWPGLRRWLAVALLGPGLAWAADPQIASLVDDPDPVTAGGTYTYTLRIDNNASSAAANTRLRFTVPSGAVFVSASPAGQNCSATSPTQVDCSLGTLGANGADVRTLVLTWRATVAGLATVNATAVVSADNDSNASNNTATAATTVVSGANLALAMAGSPDPVVAGANVSYTLTASNAGPNPSVGGMVVTANLSPSSSFVSASGSGWSCGHGAGTVTCSRAGTVAVGAAIPPIGIVATVNAASGTVTASASLAPAGGGTAEPDTSDNTASVSTAITPGGDVRIDAITVTSGTPATAGSNVSLRIEPRNAGPSTAIGVGVTHTVPAGWTLVSAGGPGWACSTAGATATCTRPSLATTAADDITLVATAPASGAVALGGTSYTHGATISSTTPDAVAANNSASVSVLVLRDGADLAITKSTTPDPVALGAPLASSIAVSNVGPRRATGPLRVVDLLSGASFVSASGAGWSCAAAGAVVTCNHANAAGLAVGARLPVLTISTTATAAGTVSNTACTGSSVPAGAGGATASPPLEGDPNSGNDCASAAVLSTSVRPDLAIAKTTSTPTGGDKLVSPSEGSVTYTLVVSNVSGTAEAATGIRITDQVPGFLAGRSSIAAPVVATVSAGSATFNCSVSGDTVSCAQTGGALNPGQTVTVPITVNRPLAEGTYTNTARVTNVSEGDPVSANNSASDTVTIQPIADVEMTGKTVTPSTVRAGENATYVLSFRNNGPSSAANVVVTDTLAFPPGDAGFTVLSIASSAAGSVCSIAAGAQLAPGAASFSCSIGTLVDGQSESITLVVRPHWQVGNGARTVPNTAAVTTTTAESPGGGDNGNNSQSTTLTVAPAELDLLVNTTDITDPVPFAAGNTFLDYRVRVTNNGPSYGTGVRFSELMTPPAGRRVRFVCDTLAAGSASCNPVPLCTVRNVSSGVGTALPAFSCSVPAGTAATGAAVGHLAVGQSKDVFLRFEVLDTPPAAGDVYTSQATSAANEPDVFAANDSESETTTTRQMVDIRVTKTPSVATVSVQQPFSWTIRVENRGPGTVHAANLSDALPAGMQVTGTPVVVAPAPGAACSLVGQQLACTLGVLDGGQVATVTLPVRMTSVPAGGTLTNTATVDNDPAVIGAIDIPGGNNTGSGTVAVTASSIAGTVFEDRDRSGANGGTPQAAGTEPRIAGVTVTLTGTDAYGNAVSQTTTTDAAGDYRFDNLAPAGAAGYTLTQTQPAGLANSPSAVPTGGPGAPTAGGSYAAGAGSANSVYTGIVLPAATAATQYHFPELRQPGLSGVVYVDLNANGRHDAGTDLPIAGATVRLLNATTGALVSSTLTDAGGAYAFTGLDPLIAYTLEQPLPASPAGLANGPVNPGLVNGAACASGCTAQPDSPAAGTDRIAAIDLSAGADGTQFNFGERQTASIAGTVFIDTNGDGTQGPAEAPLPGVTLTLVQGAGCASGTVLQTTTSAADGRWRFDGVVAHQDYLVCQAQPAGYGTGSANGTPGSNQIPVTALPAGGLSGQTFGERPAALSGTVYADFSTTTPAHTDNGAQDPGETGIAGVPVSLTGRDITGAAVNRSTTTDASGSFRFDDLLQSDGSGYTLTEGAIPASAGSFNDGRDTAGSAGGSAGNDLIRAIVLPAGTVATGYLFGELPIAPISGTVYIDRNRNGTTDAEPTDGRIPGVALTLYPGSSCSGTPAASTTTDASGHYTFSGASVGLTYTVCQTQPVGYADGPVNPGAAAASGGANRITISNLPPAGSAGNQFGELVGALAGVVVLDANHDGLRQPGEAGIPGVSITLTGTDATGAPVNRSTTTDATGAFRFDDLLAPNAAGYTLTEQLAQPVVGGVATLNGRTTPGTVAGSPLGTGSALATAPSTITGITLPAGAQGSGYFFGEILPVGVSGTVFADADNNGRPGPGEPGLPGVTIVVTGTDDTGAAVTRTTTTAADGSFSLPDLRPGTYTVTEPTQPAATSNGLTTAGPAGGTATPIGTTPSAVSGIVLTTPGSTAPGNLFAEVPANSAIAGRVWLDADNDGRIGAAEAGIAGVTVTLAGTDIAGRPVSATTTTDASGAYRFDGLVPGSYTVTEPAQPAGTLDGSTRAGTTGGTATPKGSLPSTVSGIPLGVNQASTGHDFGEVPVALIGGRVYADDNDNGTVDPGEAGLPGVTLVLTGTDDLGQPVNLGTTSAADGRWVFPNLRPGTYTVTEPTQPAGTVNGRTTAGTAGGTATPPATTPSAVSGIVLAPGAQATGNDFGEIGNSPNLLVSQTHAPAMLTVGHPSSWPISVRNGGELPTTGAYTVEGRLPTGLTLAAVPAGNGWACTATVGSATFSCVSSTVLAPGATHPGTITVSANVGAAAVPLSPVSAWVLVEGGGEVDARRPGAAERAAFAGNPAALPVCVPAIAHDVCREPAPVQLPGAVGGTVWFDVGPSSRLLDAGDQRLPGWLVEVVDKAGGQVVGRATTGPNGAWQVDGLVPGVELLIRFRDPASGVVFGYPVNGETAAGSSGAACAANGVPAAGQASSCVGSGASPALTVVLTPGRLLPQQSLPVDPSGVVYDSGSRQPVPGAVVSFGPTGSCPGWNPSAHLVGAALGGYALNGNAAAMTVGPNGFYQFLIAPGAPASCTFGLTVTPPAGYVAPSLAIPPTAGPFAPGGAAGSVVAVQPQAGPPTGTPSTATTYHLALTVGSGTAGVVHNHIPLDPALPLSLALSKTGDKARAEVGDSVRYTITVAMPNGPRPRQTTVVDRLPAGFTYIAGTATVNDRPIADPAGGVGPTLAFHLGPAPADGRLVLRYRVRVGVGAQQGDGINRAQAVSCVQPAGCVDAAFGPLPGGVSSNEGRHRVAVTGGVFTTEACVLGKAFVDCNGNHVQDREELGIPGVRLVLSDGTTLVSDSEGKYSMCGLPPRGHVLRIDPLTLPRGSRLTTSSNRNLGDAGSLWLDLKNGELHRADFVEGSCSNTVLEQTKARRAQGEVRAPETERQGGPALRFDSKAHGLDTQRSPQQGTDGANQQAPKVRTPNAADPSAAPAGAHKPARTNDESNVPTPRLPMNRPPPTGRDTGVAPEASAKGANDGPR